ncbi:MAG: hypothetical protein KatS3mg015_0930 [Fimbriimonadales bacterium]|nr:MAG: hypothetical protein KatS3mg015_0930 [Fimbriimonadales bacterium]
MKSLRTYLPALGFLLVAAITFTLLETECGKAKRAESPMNGAVARAETGAQNDGSPKRVRVATWNLMWLDETVSEERIQNIRSVIRHLDADVLALQEVASVAALRQVLPAEYEIAMAAEGGKNQNLAVAVRKPIRFVSEPVALFQGALYEEAYPDQRDPLRVYLSFPSEETVAVYVVHYKSRSGGRATTEPRRIAASCFLAAWIRSKGDKNVIVLGDFNDTPDDACLNVLETGNLLASGRIENEPDPFLVNLCEPLAADEYVSIEVHKLYRGKPVQPIAKGARDDNNRLRGQDYDYPGDVLVEQALFDQILVSHALARRVERSRADVYAGEDALRGMTSGRHGEGSLASDHLPVFVDIRY